jgi:hypothetical protein
LGSTRAFPGGQEICTPTERNARLAGDAENLRCGTALLASWLQAFGLELGLCWRDSFIFRPLSLWNLRFMINANAIYQNIDLFHE